jgi:hypothetical protein
MFAFSMFAHRSSACARKDAEGRRYRAQNGVGKSPNRIGEADRMAYSILDSATRSIENPIALRKRYRRVHWASLLGQVPGDFDVPTPGSSSRGLLGIKVKSP